VHAAARLEAAAPLDPLEAASHPAYLHHPGPPPPPSTRSSAPSFPPATGSEVEAPERRQPPSLRACPRLLHLRLMQRGRPGLAASRSDDLLDSERCGGESTAKLQWWRGRQLSWPDAPRRREADRGVVPLFSLDRLSPFFKRGCISGNRWRQSKSMDT
jgi:hypothetical protein